MGGRVGRYFSGCVAALALSVCSAAQAVVITYQATDLADIVVGEDRWQYRYKVSGFVGLGFNVLFSPALYRNLSDPPPAVNSDWALQIVQPDPNPVVLADGFYGATAQVLNPSLADAFTVIFDWLGSGSPGSQPFEVFDESFFPPIATGQTQAEGQVVPLPDTLSLIGLGLLVLRARKAVARTI